jgi:hypothetical protein
MRAEEALSGSKDEEKEVKQTEPERISENIQHSQETENLRALRLLSQAQFLLKFLGMLTY